MSVRAYKVIKIKTAECESFNLWHDDKLMEFLDDRYQFYSSLNSDSIGLVEIPLKALELALIEVPMDKELKEALQKDIDDCKRAGETFVQYYCH